MRAFLRGTGLASAVWGVLALTSAPALAALQSCSVHGVTYRLGDATKAACYGGNDTKTIDSVFELFDMTGWILADKSKGKGGDQKIIFADNPTDREAVPANWGVSDWSLVASKVVITLKKANGFAAFLLAEGVESGTWGTDKGLNRKGEPRARNGLSRGSIYYIPGTTVSQVPLPGALPLLLAGLAGLGLIGWRRRTA